MRRRFYELAQAGPAPIASEALARIAAPYRIEAEIRGRSVEGVVRQARSRPFVEAVAARQARPRQPEEQARRGDPLRAPRWAGLSLFLEDDRVEIDSNVVERSIRPLALTRKNALFAGSDGGAEHWAVVASLIETCKLIGVEPQAYVADVSPASSTATRTAASTNSCDGHIRPPQPCEKWLRNIAYGRMARPSE